MTTKTTMAKAKTKRNPNNLQAMRDIEALLQYNWASELSDFADHYPDAGHIFVAMVRVDNWLRGVNCSPES